MKDQEPSKQHFIQLLQTIDSINSKIIQTSDSLYSSILSLLNRTYEQITPDEWRQLTLNSLQALAILDILTSRTHLRTWNKPSPDTPHTPAPNNHPTN